MNVKFDSHLKLKIPHISKTKRNEEILKFVLKGFFKYLCKKLKKKSSKKNFFQLKREISLVIFQEICFSSGISLEHFLNLKFVDSKKLIIKGNKKIPLYCRSQTFRNHIYSYLSEVFIESYQRKRTDKIKTIVKNC